MPDEIDIEEASTERLINILGCVEHLPLADSFAEHFGRRIDIGIELDRRGVKDWGEKANALIRSKMN